MKTVLIYFAAALAEIVGCFAFWAWFRLDKSVFWLAPGMLFLAAFLAAGVQSRRSGGTRLCGLRWRLHRVVTAMAMGCGRLSPGSVGYYWSEHMPCRCRYHPLGAAWNLRGGRRRCEALDRLAISPSGSRIPTTRRCFPAARGSDRAGFPPPSNAAIHSLCSIGQNGARSGPSQFRCRGYRRSHDGVHLAWRRRLRRAGLASGPQPGFGLNTVVVSAVERPD